MNPIIKLLAAATVAALGVTVAPAPSGAQFGGDGEGLGGYSLRAAATPLSVIFDMPSAGIPASPLMEWDLGYTTAVLETGFGHGLATPLWPGDAVGNLGPFLSSEFNSQARKGGAPEEFEIPTIPSWPAKAEAFHPQGPAADERSLGGAGQMRAVARETSTEAVTTLMGVGLDAFIDTGSVRSVSRTFAETNQAVTEVESKVTDLVIADGLVTIDEVVSKARIVSNGRDDAVVEGESKVSGITIAGTPFVLDGDGLRMADQGDDGALVDALSEATGASLGQVGINMYVTPADDIVDGPTADRAASALMITFENAAGKQVLSHIPDELDRAIARATGSLKTKGDQTLTILVGGVNASAAASPAFSFDLDDFGGGGFGTFTGGDTGGSQVLGTGLTSGTGSAPLPTTGTVAAPPAPAADTLNRIDVQPAFAGPVKVEGVTVGMGLLGVIGLLVGARGMRRLSDTLLGAAVKEEPCPLDE